MRTVLGRFGPVVLVDGGVVAISSLSLFTGSNQANNTYMMSLYGTLISPTDAYFFSQLPCE